MAFQTTAFEGLVIYQPKVFEDQRGYFFESYHRDRFKEAGLDLDFLQDNQAFSHKGVFRGLHFQRGEAAQAKLVRVVQGAVWDLVLDLRKGSPSFGLAYGILLSAENKKQLLVPRGFAHGYWVVSETAEFVYKCDNRYAPQAEAGVSYLDPALANLPWPESGREGLLVSDKDKMLPLFKDLAPEDLF